MVTPMQTAPRANATIKIGHDLWVKAKQVAAMKEVKLQEYFDGLLRAHIERDHSLVMRKIADKQARNGE